MEKETENARLPLSSFRSSLSGNEKMKKKKKTPDFFLFFAVSLETPSLRTFYIFSFLFVLQMVFN